jgi:hypothetical protein
MLPFFKLFVFATMVRVFMEFKIPWTLALGAAFIHAGGALLFGFDLEAVALSTTFVIVMTHVFLNLIDCFEETPVFWPAVVLGVLALSYFPADVFAFLELADAKVTEWTGL